jgi:hypothetical protein
MVSGFVSLPSPSFTLKLPIQRMIKTLTKIVCVIVLGATSLWAAETVPTTAPAKPVKNWTPPAGKMYVQTLTEEIMANHPELISVNFHGVPPGLSKVYTCFDSSHLPRIGEPDAPDDIMVIETGITILDPGWHKTNDPIKKYCVMLPLRDRNGENIGLLLLAYKNSDQWAKGDLGFLLAATALRDGLQKKIPTYADLFKPAG